MTSVEIYLHFNGNAWAAMNFYKKAFGGEFIAVQRYKDVPGSEKLSDADMEKLIHISLPLTAHTTLMATDSVAGMNEEVVFGTNYHICLSTQNEKEADALFASLSSGGKIEMPMNRTFWGAYFGMCLDPFGVKWMINCTPAK